MVVNGEFINRILKCNESKKILEMNLYCILFWIFNKNILELKIRELKEFIKE